MALKKHSPIPLYFQLAEAIREQIRRGELAVGTQLPSISELGKQHGISRMTAMQAIRYLVSEGILDSRHGAGTFVAEPKLTYDALHLLSFTEEVMRQGGHAASRVLEQTVVAPQPHVAAALQLPTHEQVVKITRLRLNNEMPLVLETTYLSATLCSALHNIDLALVSLYTVLEAECGIRLARSEHTLEATTANTRESQLLAVAIGSPVLLLEGTTFDERDQPIEYFKAIYRADRFKFRFTSTRSSTAPRSIGNTPLIDLVLT